MFYRIKAFFLHRACVCACACVCVTKRERERERQREIRLNSKVFVLGKATSLGEGQTLNSKHNGFKGVNPDNKSYFIGSSNLRTYDSRTTICQRSIVRMNVAISTSEHSRSI